MVSNNQNIIWGDKMPKKIDIEVIKSKLIEMYPDQKFDFSNYKNTRSKIRVLDSEYGEWFPTPHNLLQKKRVCRARYLAERPKSIISIEEVKKRVFESHDEEVKICDETYIDISTKCKFTDKDFGEFWMIPQHVCNGHGHRKRGIKKQTKTMLLPMSELKERLYAQHGSKVKIDESTFKGLYHKAKFIHKKYGEWWAMPNNVIGKGSSHPDGGRVRIEKTCLERYSTKHAMQNKEIFTKTQKSLWRCITLKHWKDSKELNCISSYEYAIVRHLNKHKIDFKWQIKFDLSNGWVYFVDLYLPDRDKYIEIKGYFFSKRNKRKWEIFHETYTNSEIWFEKEVTDFVGKTNYKIKKEFKEAWNEKVKRHLGLST